MKSKWRGDRRAGRTAIKRFAVAAFNIRIDFGVAKFPPLKISAWWRATRLSRVFTERWRGGDRTRGRLKIL